MRQITIDDFVDVESPERLICCSLTRNFHWLRISKGHTPERFKNEVQFTLRQFEYLYVCTERKKEILSAFNGTIENIAFDFAKGSEI